MCMYTYVRICCVCVVLKATSANTLLMLKYCTIWDDLGRRKPCGRNMKKLTD